MAVQPALIASHLTRRFDARVAVDDVSLELAPGEIFALLGPNGAGKTTTLRMLAGLIKPSSGSVDVRGRIGFLTEAPGLWDRLTVERNLMVYARLHGLEDPARAVDEALDLFDIGGRKQDRAAQLSKGLKQRVALARTLLHRPDIVLLDEPTSGLDPESARDVRALILRLRSERRAVLISTHNLDEVERVADRVAVLRASLIALDTPAALRARLFGSRVLVRLARPAAPFAVVLKRAFADVRTDDRTLSIAVSDVERATPGIVRALVEAGADVVSVVADEAPLEEVYLRLLDPSPRSARAGHDEATRFAGAEHHEAKP
ncbi:MAG TPA: ABC transporter ATP-binding protein [Vicinamibacterales bacterium]|nr:ABC transporter ATP-binding protein [Vicinamibacterales bacterium]